jgi:thiol:disulfide interchange protein DsbD
VAIEVLAETDTIAPGQEVWVALKETIESGWHTYWINPGDVGEPTRISWQLPEGFTASVIHWPLPDAIAVGPLTNFGYSDEALLLVKIKAPQQLPEGQAILKAKAEWLVCKDICVPERREASLSLRVVREPSQTEVSNAATLIAAARSRLPGPFPGATWASLVAPDLVDLGVQGLGLLPGDMTDVQFFPLKEGIIEHSAPKRIEWRQGELRLRLKRAGPAQELPKSLDGVLVIAQRSGSGTLREGFSLEAAVERAAPREAAPLTAKVAADTIGSRAAIGLGSALLFAFLGGLILNVMPCVFPVLSLKALALASNSRGAATHLGHGIAYSLGVLVTFGILALLLLSLRALGIALGWGFQFQSPTFVLILAGLFFGLGLSLSGVFFVGGGLMGTGQGLTRVPGAAGSFFTGALATIAATPCTAPFMGAALGFALAAPAIVSVAVLLTMGLGFAAPMVTLSASPRLMRVLPKPGPWLETVKQALAFPLYATAAWLVWVLSVQVGSDGVLGAMVLLLGVGLAGWLNGRSDSYLFRRAVPLGVVSLAILLATSIVHSPNTTTERADSRASQELRAQAFSVGRIDELRAAGRPVFVNFTAAWCITCKVNEATALSSHRVRAAFATHNVAYVEGDWTRQNPEITQFLRKFGQPGVPFYLFYPADSKRPPRILPQLLTEASLLDGLRAVAALEPTTD